MDEWSKVPTTRQCAIQGGVIKPGLVLGSRLQGGASRESVISSSSDLQVSHSGEASRTDGDKISRQQAGECFVQFEHASQLRRIRIQVRQS